MRTGTNISATSARARAAASCWKAAPSLPTLPFWRTAATGWSARPTGRGGIYRRRRCADQRCAVRLSGTGRKMGDSSAVFRGHRVRRGLRRRGDGGAAAGVLSTGRGMWSAKRITPISTGVIHRKTVHLRSGFTNGPPRRATCSLTETWQPVKKEGWVNGAWYHDDQLIVDLPAEYSHIVRVDWPMILVSNNARTAMYLMERRIRRGKSAAPVLLLHPEIP